MKVLISADIHIDDYADYNYSKRSRLKQFDLLATRLVEIAKEYNCEEHWILGDIINRPNSRKYIEHTAKNFLGVQSSNFSKVRYILGQHDLDSKSQESGLEDTLISLFDFPNFEYMDHKFLESSNGHKFAFSNWRPEQDISWIDHVDVLFGHYTKSTFFGQDIDESKFDLMIHGDIHTDQVIDQYVSVGNPIQKDLSSLSNGSCIIFDTETLKWERVRVDEDHSRFLRIFYTDDRSKEGFDGPLTFNIFRPIMEVADNKSESEITWNNIDELIKSTCDEEGVTDIHNECITKCVPYSEIDFNFQINKLHIHGYRSIVDLDLNFDKGDRIAVLGLNGSGKSSIIKALSCAFRPNSEVKYQQSDFTDDVNITVTLTYQNKVYEITKGTNWRFVIDGQEQSYPGVRAFEADLPVRLPFVQYLDLFFINSTSSNLQVQFNPDQRIELISKFYRLDRIQAYEKTAIDLKIPLDEKWNEINQELKVKTGIADNIRTRYLELKSQNLKSKDEYKLEYDSYKELRTKYQLYSTWKSSYNNLNDRIHELDNKIKLTRESMISDIDDSKSQLESLRVKKDKVNDMYELKYKEYLSFKDNLKELIRVEGEGVTKKSELNELNSGVCPKCGSPLSNGTAKKLIDELNVQISNLRDSWVKLNTSVSDTPSGRDSESEYTKILMGLKSTHKDINDGIELLSNKISNQVLRESQLKDLVDSKSKLESNLLELESKKPEEVSSLPNEINSLEFQVTSNITKCDEIADLKLKLDEADLELLRMNTDLSNLTNKINRYNKYIEALSLNGIVMEKILTLLATKFTSMEVKYEVEAGVYRNNRYINFRSYYLSKNKYRLYESCSDGQKLICDLDFLSKLFSLQVGLLVLDEYLKHLDEMNFPKACELLKSMNVNTIVLSSLDPNFVTYTRKIELALNENGETTVKN